MKRVKNKLSERSMLRFALVVLAFACVGLGPALGQEKTQDQKKSKTSDTTKSGSTKSGSTKSGSQGDKKSSADKAGKNKTDQDKAGQDKAGQDKAGQEKGKGEDDQVEGDDPENAIDPDVAEELKARQEQIKNNAAGITPAAKKKEEEPKQEEQPEEATKKQEDASEQPADAATEKQAADDEEKTEQEEKAERHPLEISDTASPRDTIRSFLENCETIYIYAQKYRHDRDRPGEMSAVMGRIDRCLDTSEIPLNIRRNVGREAAVCLKEVLDRLNIIFYEIPDRAKLREMEEAGETLNFFRIPNTDIVLNRIPDGPRKGDYVFSAETVLNARDFYERVEHMPYAKETKTPNFYKWYLSEPGWMIPKRLINAMPGLSNRRLYGQTLWQWIGLVLVLVVAGCVCFVCFKSSRSVMRRERYKLLWYWLSLPLLILMVAIPMFVNYFVTEQLRMSGSILIIVKYVTDLSFLVALMVLIVGVGNRVAEVFISSPRVHPKGIDAQFIRLGMRVVSLGAAVVVVLEGGKMLGIPLTTLLAGAGVGGVAVALAAQDTLKNVFGSFMIVLDKPYRVGERIVAKGYDGVVEEIGLRSTRLRLLTGHAATIPNEDMARLDVENVSRRPHIRRVANLRIPLDTPADKANRAVEIIRQLLTDHEGSSPDFPPRVYLNEFNNDSLNIRMMYWFHPAEYWKFLEFGQKLNTAIMEQFEAEGIRFALPSTTTFLAQDESRPVDLPHEG